MELIVSRTVKARDGVIIIQEDTWPYYVFVLKDGKARVLKNIDGRQVFIGALTKGDIFGEMAFLGKTKRTVSVIADGDVTVEMITKDVFMNYVDKLPRNVRTRLCTMASSLTGITEIYSRLVALLQGMNVERKMIVAETLEMESKEMPNFMQHIITDINKRHSAAVEGLNRLSFTYVAYFLDKEPHWPGNVGKMRQIFLKEPEKFYKDIRQMSQVP